MYSATCVLVPDVVQLTSKDSHHSPPEGYDQLGTFDLPLYQFKWMGPWPHFPQYALRNNGCLGLWTCVTQIKL